MRANRPFQSRQHRLAWLLWLALLLPMAQAVASWHGYSHGRAVADEPERDQPASHAVHCDLCLSAAGVANAAPTGQRAGVPHLALGHALAPHAVAGVWLATLALAYLSRAPPPFVH